MSEEKKHKELLEELEQLRSENNQLKLGIQTVFETVAKAHPKLEKRDSIHEDLISINSVFQSSEVSRTLLNQNLQALDSVSDGIAIFNKKGRIIFSNKSFPKIFKLKKESLIDLHWKEIFVGNTEEPIRSLLREVNSNYPIHKEVVIPFGKKNKFISSSIYPLENGSFLANVKDVTTEKEKLYKIQEQALLLKSSGEFIGICNADFQFTFLNDAATNLFLIKDNWEGLKFNEFIEDPNHFQNTIIPKVIEKKGWIGELNIQTENRVFPVNCEILPFQPTQVTKGGYYIILRDITERKQAIKKLVDAKDEAENNMKVRQQFMANMSHEIRTPMNAIIGLTSLLLDSKLQKKQKEFAESIRLSADNLLVIINDILDISKIESGKLSIEKIPFDFNQLLDGVRTTFIHKLEDQGIKFILDQDENVPELLLGDPTRLNQILLNLVSNAAKFTEKGHVGIYIKTMKRSDHEITLQIQIEDSGIGIAKENLEKIFNVFTQESDDTTRLYGGTGLGLAIVKQLVDMQNGKIWVNSRVNKGSSFFVEIPYGIPSNDALKGNDFNKDFEFSKLKDARIIMAEDYPMNQLLAKSLFDKWGLNLTVVGNGKELLNDLNTNSYDIILMDIQMPEIDGLEATRKLRQRGIKSPVIAITAHAFKEEQEQCIKAGMNDFISKPFKEDDLKEKLITFLNLKPGDFNSISKYQQKNEMPLSNDLSYFKLDYIKEMGAGDNEFVSQMLEMFIEQVPVLLNEMIDSINKGNKKELSKFAHTIQSSFVMVERSDVKSDLKRLELWGKGQEPLDNPIGELESVIEKSKPILQSIADYLGKTINITYNPIEIVTNVDNLIEISIDFGKIEELAEGDKQFVKGMLDLYIGQTSGQLDDIRGLSKLKQFKPTSLIFHNMIASFDLIGCENLMNYSRRLENAAKENSDIDKLQTMVDQFISLTESTFELVKSKAKEDFDLEI